MKERRSMVSELEQIVQELRVINSILAEIVRQRAWGSVLQYYLTRVDRQALRLNEQVIKDGTSYNNYYVQGFRASMEDLRLINLMSPLGKRQKGGINNG